MLNLFRAEWDKAVKNIVLIGFTVWVFPIGSATFVAIGLLVGLFSDTAQAGMTATSSGQWTTDVLSIWQLVISFPWNIFGRMLPLAFMAVVFAGEFQWGVWKNIIPRSSRAKLILIKFATLSAIVLISLVITSAIIGLGQYLLHRAAGVDYGPALSESVLQGFIRDYAETSLLGMISLLILAGFAALSALLSRSVLGGLLAGFGFSVVEPMSLVLLILLGNLFDSPELINLYQFTPSFNLDNARAWFVDNTAYELGISSFTAQPDLSVSLVALAGWVVGLITTAVLIFHKQDITS